MCHDSDCCDYELTIAVICFVTNVTKNYDHVTVNLYNIMECVIITVLVLQEYYIHCHRCPSIS